MTDSKSKNRHKRDGEDSRTRVLPIGTPPSVLRQTQRRSDGYSSIDRVTSAQDDGDDNDSHDQRAMLEEGRVRGARVLVQGYQHVRYDDFSIQQEHDHGLPHDSGIDLTSRHHVAIPISYFCVGFLGR